MTYIDLSDGARMPIQSELYSLAPVVAPEAFQAAALRRRKALLHRVHILFMARHCTRARVGS